MDAMDRNDEKLANAPISKGWKAVPSKEVTVFQMDGYAQTRKNVPN